MEQVLLPLTQLNRGPRCRVWISVQVEYFLAIKAVRFDFLVYDAWSNSKTVGWRKRKCRADTRAITAVHITRHTSAFTKRVDKAAILSRVTHQT